MLRSQGWDAVQEAIMMKHVQLCIEEGKLRLARDGLHQYRVISQHANIQSLGKVVAELRSRAEAKLASAKAKAGEEEVSDPPLLAVLCVAAASAGVCGWGRLQVVTLSRVVRSPPPLRRVQ